MPDRWRNVLLSDHDQIVGAACDGVLAFCHCRVAKSKNTPTHRTFVQETTPKAIPSPTSLTSAELVDANARLFCGSNNASRGLDLHVVFGLSYGLLSCKKKHHCRQCTSCLSTSSSVWVEMCSLLRTEVLYEDLCLGTSA